MSSSTNAGLLPERLNHRLGFAWCVSLSLSLLVAACGSSGSGTPATGGRAATGGGQGSGGRTGSGGAASGGATASGGSFGTGGGASGGGGTAGNTGSGGSEATGGAGGMAFMLRCEIRTATNSVYSAASASNAPSVSDFTYTDGTDAVRANSIFFGDTYNQVTGFSYHFPDRPPEVVGGQGGMDGGLGGGAGGGMGGGGGRGGAAGGRGAAGAGGRGGAGVAGGGGGGLGGAPFQGAPGLTEDLTASNWHITGWVGLQATAFALQFTCLIDASAYTGIEFSIKGNAGTPNVLNMQTSFAGDETGSYIMETLGLCSGTCNAPGTTLNLTPNATTVQIPWTRFVGGRPMAGVDPHQLVRFLWAFTTKPVPYPVDVTIDDLKFYTAPATPTGGAGGANAGGAGGAN